jgi:hypothetical protein
VPVEPRFKLIIGLGFLGLLTLHAAGRPRQLGRLQNLAVSPSPSRALDISLPCIVINVLLTASSPMYRGNVHYPEQSVHKQPLPSHVLRRFKNLAKGLVSFGDTAR